MDKKERKAAKRRRETMRGLADNLMKPFGSPPPHVPGGEEIKFGPFTSIPVKLISDAGWNCPLCAKAVRRAGLVVPQLVPRMMIYSCDCGPSIIVWEDERQPVPGIWPNNIRAALAADADLLIFNGNKRTGPQFAGCN